MPHLIACQLGSYGKYVDRAWSHLPTIGIQNVEIDVPAANEIADMHSRLADHGLAVSSMHGIVDIASEQVVESMRPQFDMCTQFGTHYMFVSVQAGDVPRDVVWQRLRDIGAVAGEHDVTVVMETHPDLITNAAVALQTMREVDHPNVRINFDTANIYYYNENVTASGELAKVIGYVGSLHLKDTAGGLHEWNFPTLGQGVVDFTSVFALLDDAGFTGPCTMELEGAKGLERTQSEQLAHVADSAAFLRSLGVMP